MAIQIEKIVERERDDLSNGMHICTFVPSKKISAPGKITYPTGNRLRFSPLEEKPEEGFLFEYFCQNRKLVLNDLVKVREQILVPVTSEFKHVIAENGITFPKPEIRLSLDELKEDETSILSAFHEIGHAVFYGMLFDIYNSLWKDVSSRKVELIKKPYIIPGFLPMNRLEKAIAESPVAYLKLRKNTDGIMFPELTGTYGDKLSETHYLFQRALDKELEWHEERFAWAFALKCRKKYSLLPGLSNQEVSLYYTQHLLTYGRDFVKSKLKENTISGT